MPQGDGTGPGSGRGRGQGGAGRGTGQGRCGGGRFAAGPGGECVCPVCGEKKTHNSGIPCIQEACPKCGTMMVRNREQKA